MTKLTPSIQREIIDILGTDLRQLNFNRTTSVLPSSEAQIQNDLHEILKNVSLVSKEFCHFARIHLFQTVTVGYTNRSPKIDVDSFLFFYAMLQRNLGNVVRCVRNLVFDQPEIDDWNEEVKEAYCGILELLRDQLRIFGFQSQPYWLGRQLPPASKQKLAIFNAFQSPSLTRLYIYAIKLPLSVFLQFPESLKRLELVRAELDIPNMTTPVDGERLQNVLSRLESLHISRINIDPLLKLVPSPSIAFGTIKTLRVEPWWTDQLEMLERLVPACSNSLECLTLDFTYWITMSKEFIAVELRGLKNKISRYINFKNATRLRIVNIYHADLFAQYAGLALQTFPKNPKVEEIYLAIIHEFGLNYNSDSELEEEEKLEDLRFLPDSMVTALVSPSLKSLKNVKVEINIGKKLLERNEADRAKIHRIVFGQLEKKAARKNFKLEIGTDIKQMLRMEVLVRRRSRV